MYNLVNPALNEPQYTLNKDCSVAVAKTYYWNTRTQEAPKGVKLQLLTKYGVAIYGVLTKETTQEFIAWAPLPRRPDDLQKTTQIRDSAA